MAGAITPKNPVHQEKLRKGNVSSKPRKTDLWKNLKKLQDLTLEKIFLRKIAQPFPTPDLKNSMIDHGFLKFKGMVSRLGPCASYTMAIARA